eukprot:gene27626-64221_t
MRRLRVATAVAAAAAAAAATAGDGSAGCGSTPPVGAGGAVDVKLASGPFAGYDYLLRVPAGYTGEPAPLLLMLHGWQNEGNDVWRGAFDTSPFILERGRELTVTGDGVCYHSCAPCADSCSWATCLDT